MESLLEAPAPEAAKPEKTSRRKVTAAYLDKLEANQLAVAEIVAMQTRQLAILTEMVQKLVEQVARIQPVVINQWGPMSPTKPEAAPNMVGPGIPIGVRLSNGV